MIAIPQDASLYEGSGRKHLGAVAVVGGGLAGLAASCALADAGYQITLFERRPFLGGRASSYEHPGTGEVVDNCQHVLLGCCTNLIDFYTRTGVADKIRWFDKLNFIEPGGRMSVIGPSLLPAPFHSAPSFLAAASLSPKDKLAIGRALSALMPKAPQETNGSFLSWLKRHNQTQPAIDRFWSVVLVSALNEELDRISVRYAAQVFRESFLKSPEAGRMGVPTVPLTDLYAAAADYIRARGGEVRLRSSVDGFQAEDRRVSFRTAGEFDYTILAVPFDVLAKMLPPGDLRGSLQEPLSRFELSPITGIHLWFDRQITDLPHAVLLDRTVQWMFHKSALQPQRAEQGSYLELVVSASRSLVEMTRQEIIDLALRELAEFFSPVRHANMLKAAVIKEVKATYSVRPQCDSFRPQAQTVSPRVFLAGDWTHTGWPATMEGAVRSGYLAAEALTRSQGKPMNFLVPDLPPRGLMRLFGD